MKKYRVFGHTSVTVTTVIEVDDKGGEISEEEIYEIAQKQFSGVIPFAGNGGLDKLIGVVGSKDTIESDEEVEFDDFIVEE